MTRHSNCNRSDWRAGFLSPPRRQCRAEATGPWPAARGSICRCRETSARRDGAARVGLAASTISSRDPMADGQKQQHRWSGVCNANALVWAPVVCHDQQAGVERVNLATLRRRFPPPPRSNSEPPEAVRSERRAKPKPLVYRRRAHQQTSPSSPDGPTLCCPSRLHHRAQ